MQRSGYLRVKLLKDNEKLLERNKHKFAPPVMLKRVGTKSEDHYKRRWYLGYLTSKI